MNITGGKMTERALRRSKLGFRSLLLLFLPSLCFATSPSPSLVGWTNLFLPGAGASLRGNTASGYLEALTEVGLYAGGQLGNSAASFNIDGTDDVTDTENLTTPIVGTMLQEAGLKLHFYNTFYHYQQASFAAEKDPDYAGPKYQQPIYRGDTVDILAAPFQLKNLASPWVLGGIAAATAYLFIDYKNTPVRRRRREVTSTDDFLFGLSQIAVIPAGSAYGEEPLFRGFLQREFHAATDNLLAAIVMQSVIFAAMHPPELRVSAFFGGIYSGLLTYYYDGDLGPAIAAHFWMDVVDGLVEYFVFHRSQGKDTPFAPPLNFNVSFRF